MAKKNKVIYLDPPHRYDFGSFMQGIESGAGLGKFGQSYAGLSSGMQGALGGLGNMVGQLGGSAISNGYETGAGSVISGLGNVASAIPGPWGAVASAGLGLIGGLVNRAFGVKEDKEKHQRLDTATSYLNTFTSAASSFDEVNGPLAMNLDSSVYQGGWFSKGKAAKKNKELAEKAQDAQDRAYREVTNNVTAISKNQMNDLMASYFAFGGPFGYGYPIGGAIDYEIAQAQLAQKELKAKKALGGALHTHGADWTNSIIIVDNGGSHEQNPLEGVPMGMGPDGRPNLVEEGEVIYKDYVFSNRLKVPKSVQETYKLKGKGGLTFAEAAKQAQKESEERPNDPISKRGLEDIMSKLISEQEAVREKRERRTAKYAYGGKMGTVFAGPGGMPNLLLDEADGGGGEIIGFTKNGALLTDGTITTSPDMYEFAAPASPLGTRSATASTSNKTDWSTWLRYAPILGSAFSVAQNLISKPDYSGPNAVLEAAERAGTYDKVRYTPVGEYLTYNPLDRLFYANQLGAQAGATRRNILNTSGGNRGTAMAGLLASDFNAQTQLGKLYRQAEEYNMAQREKVATFNRATNMANSEMGLKASIANQEAALKARSARLNGITKAMEMRDAIDQSRAMGLSTNLTNLFEGLGDVGREAVTSKMILSNPALYYSIDPGTGAITYKNGYDTLSDAAKDEVNRHAAKASGKAYGGYLTIKKRRK